MVTIFSLNDLGRVFNFTLPSTITPADVVSQKIIFYKPDRTRFEKIATRAAAIVTYDNSAPDTTILDERGNWEFTAQVVLTGDSDILEVPQKDIFWVV